MSPRKLLLAGMAALIAGNVVLAKSDSYAGLAVGVTLWGAHMALTQGIFSRMIADSAPEELRATSFGAFWFVSGIAGVTAGLMAVMGGIVILGFAFPLPGDDLPALRTNTAARAVFLVGVAAALVMLMRARAE